MLPRKALTVILQKNHPQAIATFLIQPKMIEMAVIYTTYQMILCAIVKENNSHDKLSHDYKRKPLLGSTS
ncbi:MAG: hypothetical protein QNJ51_13265 [Calothrix sp. MO_167.B12]|nr:hypothetical protein [Calothrix sp. MO_167.B12]